MRFRFCCDADCPDWVLAEMTLLSRLSSVKLKLLTQLVMQAVVTPPLEIEKAVKLFVESKLDPGSELQRCVACISFLAVSAARAGCDAAALAGELQQLGLPREHASALRRVYVDYAPTLRTALAKHSLRMNKLEDVNAQAAPILDAVELSLSAGGRDVRVRLSRALAMELLRDARVARDRMQEIAAVDHAL